MVILLGAFGPISTDMFLPALPDMVDEFDTTAAVMNMALYGFMFSMAVSILLLGPVTDKYGRLRWSYVWRSMSSPRCCVRSFMT